MRIHFKNISKAFGKKIVLDDIDLHLEPGNTYCILGKNGAGKTTLMNLLLQLSGPTKGELIYDGTSLEELPQSLKMRIGAMSEDNPLIEELTGRQYFKLYGQLYGLPRNDMKKRVDDLTSYFFDDPDDLKKRLSAFSTGMKKKIGLMASVLHTPDLLVLDEPFSGLDPVAAKMTIDFIKAYQNGNRTIFLSSHDLAYVAKVVTHLAVLDEGKIVFAGTLQDFTNHGQSEIDSALLEVLQPDTRDLGGIEWF
ncbi:MAG: ABC transporter ATP-binding protein [Bacteroidetes bacterium]|nr:MAG: ABC transporter ATP-binding protein [Bacteroidota bacterium]